MYSALSMSGSTGVGVGMTGVFVFPSDFGLHATRPNSMTLTSTSNNTRDNFLILIISSETYASTRVAHMCRLLYRSIIRFFCVLVNTQLIRISITIPCGRANCRAQFVVESARFSHFFASSAANFSCFASFSGFRRRKCAKFALFDILSHCFPYFYCRMLAHFRAVRINEKNFLRRKFLFLIFSRNFAFILQNLYIYPHGFSHIPPLHRRSLTAQSNSVIFILCNRTYKKIHSSRTTCKSPSFPSENAVVFGK